jgi:Fe-S oxidoreductase
VEALGGKTTMIDLCCGSSLKSAGFLERAGQLSDRILDEVLASGARTVVTVCPGCCEAIRETVGRRGASVRVVSLPHFLLEKGFEPVRGLDASTICLAKSCQDRDGTYLDDTMRLLGLPENAPVVFRGCCGAGGAVSAFDYDQHDAQSASKLDAAHDGDTFVSMCPTCTYTYAFNLMSAPQNVSNLNYLELVFDNGFDWQTVSDRLNGMWTGEYGPWLAQVFA